MSVFLSASYFVSTNDRLGAMIFGNLRYGFDVAPMSGFANIFSGNLGNFEAGCGFELSANGVAYDATDCKVSHGAIAMSVQVGQFTLFRSLAYAEMEFQVLMRGPSFTAPA
jgi:hypothetical protein